MARTPMSAPGSRRGSHPTTARGGFTLLELLLVVALIAMAGAGVGFALRDAGDNQVEREAQRLVALLDAARAQSRASGVPVVWHADADGFEFAGLPAAGAAHTPWMAPGMSVRDGSTLLLGPEPIIERQQLELVLGTHTVRIATDGLRPFSVLASGPDSPLPGSR